MLDNAPAGFKALDEMPSFTHTALLELVGKGIGLTIHGIHAKTTPLGIDVLVDVSWQESHGSGKNQRTVTVYQTVLFLHRPESKLPDFRVNHHEGLLSSWGAGNPETAADAVVEFEDREKLAKRFTISSPVPASARILFTDDLLDALDGIDGMEFRGNHNGVIAWHERTLMEDSDRRRFAESALSVFGSALDDPELGNRIAASVPGTYAMEQVKRWEQEGTRAARKLLDRVITRAHVDSVMGQAIPRTPPRPVVKQALGLSTLLIAIGLVVTLFFLPLGVIGLIVKLQHGEGVRWEALLIIAFGLGAAILLFYAVRKRKQQLWLLRRGRFVDAKVVSVQAPSSSTNGQLFYKITFAPVERDGKGVAIKLRTDPSRIAQRIQLSGGTTPLLVDPDRPKLGLWLEGWVLENIPD